MRLIAPVSLFIFVFSMTGKATPVPAASPWAEMARTDLAFVRETLQANHPGPVDDQNERFRDWLEAGYAIGLERADNARSLVDATSTLSAYIAGFADGHLGLGFTYVPKTLEWPGFVIARRGHAFVVHHKQISSDSDLPEIGWELQDCDGRTADQILDADVLPALDGRGFLQATKTKLTPQIFVAGVIAGRAMLERCSFTTISGKRTLTLKWQPIERSALMPLLTAAAFGPAPDFSVSEFERDRHWISIPTFSPDGDAEVNSLRNAIRAVEALQKSELVVLDVRGNSGGNSQWGHDILAALYGREMVEAASGRLDSSGSFAEWRVSPPNHDYIVSFLPTLQDQFGADSAFYRAFSQLTVDMGEAILAGRNLVRQPEVSSAPAKIKDWPTNPVTAKVVLLTDGRCGSACLDFADLFRTIPGTIHAGQETSADTVYMDLRSVDLPSGLASMGFAMKVYRNRPRANNQPYEPTEAYDGDIGDTNAVRAWLVERLLSEGNSR